MKLKLHEGQGTVAATGIAKVLSNDFGDLTLAVGPPRYYRSKGILMLPGIPAGEIPRAARVELLGFLSHESWERRWGTWNPVDERWQDKPGLRALVNALGDAYVDRLGAEEYPGAGMHVRAILRRDYMAIRRKYRKGTLVLTIRTLAVLVRHVAEGIVPFRKVRTDFSGYAPLLDIIEPILNFLDVSSLEACIEQATAMYEALRVAEVPDNKSEQVVRVPEEVGGEHDTEQETLQRITDQLFPGQEFRKEATQFEEPSKLPSVYTFDPSQDVVYAPATRNAILVPPERYAKQVQLLLMLLRQALTTNLPLPRRRQERGEIDGHELSRLVTGERDVFLQRQYRPGLSTAAVLSWDESDSMKGERIEEVRLLAHAVNESLGRLRIPTMLHGWTTQGKVLKNWNVYRQEALRHRVYKGFDESWERPEVLKRLAKIDTMDGTPTGEGILFAANALSRRTERRRVLFVMTDGEPCIAAHGSPHVHHEFIRYVLDQCAQGGIEVIGLGIRADLSPFFHNWVEIAGDIFGGAVTELVNTLRRK
jgi:hypothetical protein